MTAENQYACHDLSVWNKRKKSHLISQNIFLHSIIYPSEKKKTVLEQAAFWHEVLIGTAQGVGLGGFSPPTFLAVDGRTLNVQLEIFKVLMKDGEFTCFDDILAKIKQLSEA